MSRLPALCLLGLLPVLHGQPLRIRTVELPWAMVDTAYHAVIETGVDGRCPSGDTALSLAGGSLPDGLEMRGDSLLGTPVEIGAFGFSVQAANGCAAAVRAFELVVTGKPILRVFPEAIAIERHAGQASPAPPVAQVSATWPGLPYLAEADAAWLRLRVRAGTTPGKSSALAADTVTLEIDSKSLPPGTYHASVGFSTWQGANAPSIAVTLTVLP
jgi:hypothetical protein